MKPREPRESGQHDMFRSRLDQILDMGHEKVILSDKMSTAEQNRSKGRRKTGPFSVMRYAVLRVVPLVHRRAPRCFA